MAMAKYGPAIVMGALAGIAMFFLMKTLVFPDGPAAAAYGLGTGIFFAYILANLAGNRKEVLANSDQRREALQFQPPPGKAQLVVCRDGFVGRLAGLNLAVDGRPFGQIKSPRFTSVTLAPGQHTLTCAFGGLAGPQSRAGSYAFEAMPGRATVVKIGAQMGLVQGSFQFTPMDDLAAAKAKLDYVPMIPADVVEV
jgi:hypothetical protein